MGNLLNTNKKSNPFEWKTAAALVAANFFFGTNIIAVKKISPSLIDPMGLSFARMLITGVLLSIIIFASKSKEKIDRSDITTLILAGLFGVTCNQIFSIVGIANTNPIHASLLIMATPIIVSVLAAIFLKERFGWNKFIGLLMGVTGATLLILFRDHKNNLNPATFLGDAFIVCGAVCYSTYLILIRKISAKYNPLTILRFVFIFGTIFSLPFCLKTFAAAKWDVFSGMDWYALFHIIILGTFMAYLLMNMGVTKWGPSRTGSFIYFQPLFGSAAAILVMHENLTLIKIISGILIILGVWITSLKIIPKTSKENG